LPFVPEENVGKALISIEDPKQWFPMWYTKAFAVVHE